MVPSKVDECFSPNFSWWVAIMADRCQVQVVYVDFKNYDVGVMGDPLNRKRFANEYNRVFNNPTKSLLSQLLGGNRGE